jgi:thiamine biosynthesis lipoprotein
MHGQRGKRLREANLKTRRDFFSLIQPRPAVPESHWLHVSRSAMACRFEVTIPIEDHAGVLVARDALDQVDRLEEQLTVFRETSEVSFVNQHAPAEFTSVSMSLFELLLLCGRLYRETEGAFDITSGPLIRAWGFLRREGRVPNMAEMERARSVVGFEKLWLDSASHRVLFDRPGVEINLGSIGKGYALDCVAASMRGRVKSALLSGGSSSFLTIGNGGMGHKAWPVGLRDPRDHRRRMALLKIRDCAISTSGSEEQFFELEGKRYGHIIDPRSGLPADTVSGVTVVAESAAVSDALSTAFYVGGALLAESYCSTHPDVLAVVLERDADRPICFGRNDRCEVEII